MIDDSILSMVAIGLTLLFLGMFNGYKLAASQLPDGALPQITLPVTPSGTTGSLAPVIKPGTLLAGAIAPLSSWAAKLGHDHPLVGRVWSTDQHEAVLPAELMNAAADADVLLLGETHDNPDHHKLQAWFLRELANRNRHPAIVMEMIGTDKTETLASYQATQGTTADGLGGVLDWANSGWPDWQMYRPVADAAMAAGMTIVPGDAPKTQYDQLKLNGMAALTNFDRNRLGIAHLLPVSLASALIDDVKTSHCNLLQDTDLGPMADVQRFRDATLADNVLKAVQKYGSGAVLIAGSGHVRLDRGVPYYLSQRAPGLKVVSVIFSEVADGVENPEDAVPRDPDGKPAASFVWFTARADRPNQCDALRRQLPVKSNPG